MISNVLVMVVRPVRIIEVFNDEFARACHALCLIADISQTASTDQVGKPANLLATRLLRFEVPGNGLPLQQAYD